jgi:hypothetical protein
MQSVVVLTDRRLIFVYQWGKFGKDWRFKLDYSQQSFFIKVGVVTRYGSRPGVTSGVTSVHVVSAQAGTRHCR